MKLRWSATGHSWFAKTDEVLIFVSEETYERCLRAYLKSREMEWKTWTEIMRPAEEAWRRQCEVIDHFQGNLQYWLACKDPGVRIVPRKTP